MLFGKLKSASTSYLPHFRFLKTIDERAEDTTKDHYEVHVGHAFDGHPLSAKEKKAFDLCRKLVESVGGWVRNADEKKEKNFFFNLPDGVLNPIDVNDKRFGNVHVSVDNWKMMGKALSKMIVEVEGETWI